MKNDAHWHYVALEDVAEIQTGLSKSDNRRGEFVTLPYLRVANVQNGHFDLSKVKTIEVPKNSVERFRVRSGDVLLTEGGDFDKLGRGAVWRGQIEDCVHQNHVFVVRPHASQLDERFFAYQTQGPRGRAYFQSCSKQSTNLASVNSTQLRQFPTALPSLAEQRKIADILTTWDEGLEKLDALIAAKDRRKNMLRESIFRQICREQSQELGRLVRILPSNVDKKSEAGEKPVRLCNYTDVYYREIIDDTIAFMEATAKPHEIEKFALQINDVLITKDSEEAGDIAVPSVVVTTLSGVLCGYHLALLRPDPLRVDGRFLAQALRVKSVKHQFSSRANGVTRYGLTLAAMASVEIPLAPLKKQRAIAAILDTCDAELRLLRAERTTLAQQKRGLMQRLLTGKVRVAV